MFTPLGVLVERGIELLGPVGEGAIVAMAGSQHAIEVGPGAGNGRFLVLLAGVHKAGFEHLACLVVAVVFFFPFQPGKGGGAGDGQGLAQGLLPGVAQLIQAVLGIAAVQVRQGNAAILSLDVRVQRMPGGAGGQVQGPVPGELVEALFQLAGVQHQTLGIGGGASQVGEPVFQL